MIRQPTGRFASPPCDAPAPTQPRLARFLAENQCPDCLGWHTGARRLAEQTAGRRAAIRACVCTGQLAPAGQEILDFGGAA